MSIIGLRMLGQFQSHVGCLGRLTIQGGNFGPTIARQIVQRENVARGVDFHDIDVTQVRVFQALQQRIGLFETGKVGGRSGKDLLALLGKVVAEFRVEVR